MADHGSQEHVFTPIQTYVNGKVDGFFGISQQELLSKEVKEKAEPKKPWISIQKS
jgi:hypothetical protein